MAARVDHADVISLQRRQSLSAIVDRACQACSAPAHYLSAPSIRNGWPGCYVPEGDPREHSLVGPKCPNCGALRPHREDKGEIWVREARLSWLGRAAERLVRFFRRR